MTYNKVVSCSLSPNTDADDVRVAWSALLLPWRWADGSAKTWVRDWFATYTGSENIVLTTSGRSALCLLLESAGIGKDDEVIIGAFTCVAVPNSIIWAGATPVYVDIDKSYNIDPQLLEKKITKKTKAIIVQHTFGIPANVEKIVAIKNKYKLLLIEDCAHCLGVSYKGKSLGTFGDAAFFSFGRDKIVSSVWGGAAVSNSKFLIFNLKLKKASFLWTLQQLLHPILFSIILPTYNLVVGKVLLWFFMKTHILSYPVSKHEKKELVAYPNALAILLQHQLKKLEKYNLHRKEIIEMYDAKFRVNPNALLRYPMMVDNPKTLRDNAKKQGILLGSWYSNIIDPKDTDFSSIGYVLGSCPVAEDAAKHIINLPTRITKPDAMRIINL